MDKPIYLSEAQVSALQNALRVAVHVFADDEATMNRNGQPGVAQQFARQAREATELHSLIENRAMAATLAIVVRD
jgi:hypothetical protein